MSHFKGLFKLHETTFPRGDAGRLAQLMGFMLKGQVLRFETASKVMQQITGSKQGALAKASFTKFIGRSSDNLCVVHATLPCKIYEVQMDEKLKKLPKQLREYYVQSAISDALSKARRMVYEESEEGRVKAMSMLAEAISTGEGVPKYIPTDGWDMYRSGQMIEELIEEEYWEPEIILDGFKETMFTLPKLDTKEGEEIRQRIRKEREILDREELIARKKELEEAEASQREMDALEQQRLEKTQIKTDGYVELDTMDSQDIEEMLDEEEEEK